ncbi:MAG: TetR/AcrR family transcriptional regulator [Myxococcota bacterium]|jgi:AcrR family transcriptional regulator
MPRARNAIRRRVPKQERSRRLVEAIVEAARILLAESGAEALTTVNVAQRAGVSVGSLYQYFAGRDALLFALYEDEVTRFRSAWRAWRSDASPHTTRDRIGAGLSLTLAHYRRLAALEPAFFLAHREEIVRGSRAARGKRPRAVARVVSRDDVLRARGILRPERLERADVASFLMTHGVPGILDAALANEPAILAAPEFEAELHALVAGYLLGTPSAS